MLANLRTTWMIREHLDRVLEIEQASFDSPWDEDQFIRILKERAVIGLVALHLERVVGYAVYELCRQHITLHGMAVDPEFRRQGVGRAIIEALTGKLTRLKWKSIGLIVGDDQQEAHLFLRACGFRAVDVLRSQSPEAPDIYRFRYSLAESPIAETAASAVK